MRLQGQVVQPTGSARIQDCVEMVGLFERLQNIQEPRQDRVRLRTRATKHPDSVWSGLELLVGGSAAPVSFEPASLMTARPGPIATEGCPVAGLDLPLVASQFEHVGARLNISGRASMQQALNWASSAIMAGSRRAAFQFWTQLAVCDQLEVEFDLARGLQPKYVVVQHHQISRFLQTNRHLFGLLLDALDPLMRAFGDSRTPMLDLSVDEDGSATLFCIVPTAKTLEDARASLNRFDEAWWLKRVKQAKGVLNFDFELT